MLVSSTRPLVGRTILLTRPQDTRDELAVELESAGARILWCPTIAITDPDSYDALDAALSDLFGYDWVIFTSVNGVEYFVRRLEALGHTTDELDDLRVCAIGDATADKLRDASIHADLVPTESRAEGVYRALCDYLGSAEALNTLNFLLPRAAVARDFLPRALVEAGARVDDVAAYRTVAPGNADLVRIRTLLEGGGIDGVVFTSSSAVRNFAALFDVAELRPLLDGVKVACIGEVTSATAREFGVNVDVQPAEPNFTALGAAIAKYFSEIDQQVR
jgi:uroporphyrinogen III methyltransferase/synthase